MASKLPPSNDLPQHPTAVTPSQAAAIPASVAFVPPPQNTSVGGPDNGDDAHRASGEREPLLRRQDYRNIPIAAVLFAVGWLTPMLWFYGAWFASSSDHREVWWGKINILMSIFFISLSFYVAFAIIVNNPRDSI
ncbi:hypothetical protein BC936DRAFT_139050 [Jimgerdemannia flammicorona]|uniref:Uncharacterized protein n=1 Tax=Jimgerdemannia flammicorona TaxID=994334 RepID=A0A433DHW6_9FUNG|nr:hypothetical protein BC936DRAFT_139050 [Jimgerdemannia flammicorona]